MMLGFHTYAVARTKPLAGRVRTAVAVAVLAFAQSACQSTVDRSDLIERGKSEFEDVRFHDAKAHRRAPPKRTDDPAMMNASPPDSAVRSSLKILIE